jgi:hypothetical protein
LVGVAAVVVVELLPHQVEEVAAANKNKPHYNSVS